MRKKTVLYFIPAMILVLLLWDSIYTGVNPYLIPPPLGWLQDSNAIQGVHCSFAMPLK